MVSRSYVPTLVKLLKEHLDTEALFESTVPFVADDRCRGMFASRGGADYFAIGAQIPPR